MKTQADRLDRSDRLGVKFPQQATGALQDWRNLSPQGDSFVKRGRTYCGENSKNMREDVTTTSGSDGGMAEQWAMELMS